MKNNQIPKRPQMTVEQLTLLEAILTKWYEFYKNKVKNKRDFSDAVSKLSASFNVRYEGELRMHLIKATREMYKEFEGKVEKVNTKRLLDVAVDRLRMLITMNI